MKIIQRPRGGGKTTALIKMMQASSSLIYVASSEKRAQEVWRATGNVHRDRFKSAQSLRSWIWLGNYSNPSVVVDDLDEVLRYLLNAPVKAATLTGVVDTVEARWGVQYVSPNDGSRGGVRVAQDRDDAVRLSTRASNLRVVLSAIPGKWEDEF